MHILEHYYCVVVEWRIKGSRKMGSAVSPNATVVALISSAPMNDLQGCG